MALFGRKQSKMNNSVAGAYIPESRAFEPGPTTIHNHGVNWFAVIASAVFSAVVVLMLSWFALRFLVSQIGSTDPDRDSAYIVIYGVGLLGFVWLISWIAGPMLDSWFNFKLEVQREITRQKLAELQAAQTTIEPGRMNEEDYQFAKVILAVMMTAYQWQENSGRVTFPGKWRPWSMRSALETAAGIGVKLSHERANAVSVWLHSKGIITSAESGQIDKKYSDLTSVRVMLDREFGRPIQVVLSPTVDNTGYVHINK